MVPFNVLRCSIRKREATSLPYSGVYHSIGYYRKSLCCGRILSAPTNIFSSSQDKENT